MYKTHTHTHTHTSNRLNNWLRGKEKRRERESFCSQCGNFLTTVAGSGHGDSLSFSCTVFNRLTVHDLICKYACAPTPTKHALTVRRGIAGHPPAPRPPPVGGLVQGEGVPLVRMRERGAQCCSALKATPGLKHQRLSTCRVERKRKRRARGHQDTHSQANLSRGRSPPRGTCAEGGNPVQ